MLDNKIMEKDIEMMRLALAEAKKAAEKGEIPIGAVVCRGEEVIAVAHNLCETNQKATHHAEMLALDAASEKIGSWRLSDCELYVTLEPCPMCMGAAIRSRVRRVVYGAQDARAGACGSLVNLPAYPLEASPDCVEGILAQESVQLLQDFFQERRKIQIKSRPKG